MNNSDATLVTRTLAGDNRAFEALVTRHEQRVVGCCFRMLGNSEDAADGAQETFVKAYFALESFDSRKPILPWLLRIAVNTCKDILRSPSRARWTELDDKALADDTANSPERTLLEKESLGHVERAVIDLPEDLRNVVALFYYGQLSVDEIAQATNVASGTVKWRLHEARHRLRQSLMERQVCDEVR